MIDKLWRQKMKSGRREPCFSSKYLVRNAIIVKKEVFLMIAQSSNTRGVCFPVNFPVPPFFLLSFPIDGSRVFPPKLIAIGDKDQNKPTDFNVYVFPARAPVTLTFINIFFL